MILLCEYLQGCTNLKADIALINIFNSEAAGVGDLHPVEMLQDQVRKLFLNAGILGEKAN